MKIRKLLLLLACAIGAMVSCDTPETIPQSYTRFVEPRIGTAHCRYFHFAPGAMPFGMAKPGPSTNGHLGNKDGWEATGYDYRDKSIEGGKGIAEAIECTKCTFVPLTGGNL